MKNLLAITAVVFGLFLLVLLHFSAKTIYDYGLVCTKCLQDRHIVDYRYFGLTYRKTEKLQEDPTYYQDLMGRECRHVFHKAGFGRQRHGMIGCGMTAEGIHFRVRNEAVEKTFRLGSKLQAPDLVRQTMTVVDSLLPPDSNWQNREAVSEDDWSKLYLLESILETIADRESWTDFLSAIEGGSLSDYDAQYAHNNGRHATASPSPAP